MHVLVVATPRFPIPPEQLPAVVDGALEWHERYKDRLEAFGTFPGGGGFGVVNVADEAALNQMVLDMPFSPFNRHEIRPFVAGAVGINQLRDSLAAQAAMQHH